LNTLRILSVMAVGVTILCCAEGVHSALAQGVDVSAKVEMRGPEPSHDATRAHGDSPNAVVLWLTPLQPEKAPAPHHDTYKLVQKNKQFIPHLLVVPTGSSVEFPNEDPFFHNVFSLFNGKRFDLGLYEPGTSRSVRFDREGVSYIFCNIHPEMGAVVLSLSTPYYAVSPLASAIVVHNVPPGRYRLSVWSQNGDPASMDAAVKTIQVGTDNLHLGTIPIRLVSDPMAHHTNKFGEEYPPDQHPPY
jgi:plastocyanin